MIGSAHELLSDYGNVAIAAIAVGTVVWQGFRRLRRYLDQTMRHTVRDELDQALDEKVPAIVDEKLAPVHRRLNKLDSVDHKLGPNGGSSVIDKLDTVVSNTTPGCAS